MKTKTTFALAALIALGTASTALAQDSKKHVYTGADPLALGLERSQKASAAPVFEGRNVGTRRASAAGDIGQRAFEDRLTFLGGPNAY